MHARAFAILLICLPSAGIAQSLRPDFDPRFAYTGDRDTLVDRTTLPSTCLPGTAGGQQAEGATAFAPCAGALAVGHQATALNSAATAIGTQAEALGQTAVAVGIHAYAAGVNSTALGPVSAATGAGSTALGYQAWASGIGANAFGFNAQAHGMGANAIGLNATADGQGATALGTSATARGTGAVAIGAQAQANATGSIALGQGSVANERNTVSVGSSTQQRRITNVAAGINPTDAVNMMQLDDLWGFTRNGFNQVNRRIDVLSDRIDGVGAMSAAMSMMSAASYNAPGRSKLNVGVGSYNGQSAIALGYSRPVGTRGSFALGASTNGDGTMVGAGFSFALD